MKKFKQFNVHVKDKPGTLATLTKVLSKNAINLTAINVERYGVDAIIKFTSGDENTTRRVLKENNYSFDESLVLRVPVPNKVGELAKVSEKLYNSNVNIRSIYLMAGEVPSSEKLNFLFDLSDLEKGEVVLRNYSED